MKKNKEFEDDNRVIADMSEIGSERSIFSSFKLGRKNREFENPDNLKTSEDNSDRPWEINTFSKQERKMYILAALKASLLIGFTYIIGFGVIIFLLIMVWSLI